MTYTQVMEYVEELKRYGSVPGLTNVENLCLKLGQPQRDLSFIHIAGTNGKGSVLAFISEIFFFYLFLCCICIFFYIYWGYGNTQYIL